MQGSVIQLKKRPRQSGAIVLEYIVLAAVLVLGLVVGVSAFRDMVKPILGEPGGGAQNAAVASAQPANSPIGAQQGNGALQGALAANDQPSNNAQPGLPTAQDPRDLLLRPNGAPPPAPNPSNEDDNRSANPAPNPSNENDNRSAKPPKSRARQIADATGEFLKEELGYNDGKKALADFKKGNILGGLKHSGLALLGVSNVIPAKAGVSSAIFAGKWAGKWAIKKAGKSKVWKWLKNKFKKPKKKTKKNTSCFTAGTLIASEAGPKFIENIRLGDFVLSRNEKNGEISYAKVVNTIVTHHRKILNLHFIGKDGRWSSLEATPDHPFWVVGQGWVTAGDLAGGDKLVTATQEPLYVAAIDVLPGTATVYNFEVEATHTYFVGEVEIWVHNNDCSGKGPEKTEGGHWVQSDPKTLKPLMKKKKTGRFKPKDDIPDQFKQAPFLNESGKSFAERVLREAGLYDPTKTGPGSLFNKLKKYADQHWKNP